MEITIIAAGFDVGEGPVLNPDTNDEIQSKRLTVFGVDRNSYVIIVDVKSYEERFLPYLRDPEGFIEKQQAEMDAAAAAAEARAKIALPGLISPGPEPR